jgi:hypothetical protein
MKASIHLWSYLAQLFLEWEMFQTKVVEIKQNPRFMFGNFSPAKIVPFVR